MPIGPFSRRHPVRVLPFFGFRSDSRLHLSARALRTREPAFEKRSFWRDFVNMVGQYLSHEEPGVPVELRFELPDGEVLTQKAVSDDEGYVRFDIDLPQGSSHPERTRWELAHVRWSIEGEPEGEAKAWILAPGSQTRTGIISDIDDTILETGITGSFRMIARNWKRVMAQMPSERTLVPGAASFYSRIGGKVIVGGESEASIDAIIPKARVRPVFYVSSSPWNLFSYLITFKRERGLPLGPVMLRDWGFNRKTLGSKSHGSHKVEAIDHIVTTFPDLRFALIGDDTQKDLIAFGDIAMKFPGRIAAVFIRAASGDPFSEEEKQAVESIKRAGVPFWTGSDYEAAMHFLESAGLDFDGGVDQLVRAASEKETPEAA